MLELGFSYEEENSLDLILHFDYPQTILSHLDAEQDLS